MKRLVLAGLLLAGAPAFASEIDAVAPALFWGADFGARERAPAPRYGFALNLRGADADARSLLKLQAAPTGLLATLAGVPVAGRSYGLNQAEGAEPVAASSPWYARQWVWWTAGGLAATAALVGAADDEPDNDNDPSTAGGPSGDNPEVGVACVNGECVAHCGDFDDPTTCGPGFAARRSLLELHRDTALDTGTGAMGDLISR